MIHAYGLCYVLNYVLQNLHVSPPVTQNVIIFGNKFFKEVIELKWAIDMGTKSNMIGALVRRGRDTRGVCTQKVTMWRGSKRMVICRPRCEASGETKPTNTLTLHFQPPEPWKNKFLLFKLPSLLCSIRAATTTKAICEPEGEAKCGKRDRQYRGNGPWSMQNNIASQAMKMMKCLLPNNLTYMIFLIHLLLKYFNICLFPLNIPVQSFEIWNLIFKLPMV